MIILDVCIYVLEYSFNEYENYIIHLKFPPNLEYSGTQIYTIQ